MDVEWALEIVNRAVLDWRRLIAAKAWKCKCLKRITNADPVPNPLCNFSELRQFFNGEWCELILEANGASVTAEYILSILERELQAAIKKDEEREKA